MLTAALGTTKITQKHTSSILSFQLRRRGFILRLHTYESVGALHESVKHFLFEISYNSMVVFAKCSRISPATAMSSEGQRSGSLGYYVHRRSGAVSHQSHNKQHGDCLYVTPSESSNTQPSEIDVIYTQTVFSLTLSLS